MPYKDPEKRREYQRLYYNDWYRKNKDAIRKQTHEYYIWRKKYRKEHNLCSKCGSTIERNIDGTTHKTCEPCRRECREKSVQERKILTEECRCWRCKMLFKPTKKPDDSGEYYKFCPLCLEKERRRQRDYNRRDSTRYNDYQKAAKKRGVLFKLTFEEFVEIKNSPCHYCGSKTKIGIDRQDNNGGYTKQNSFSCCFHCNRAKGDMSVAEFVEMAQKIHENFKGYDEKN